MKNVLQALILATTIWGLPLHAAVLTFQEGVNGYTGNDATYIYATNFSTNHDGLDFMNTGGSGNASLVRFRDIFGAAVDQVDAGATINSATLTLNTLPTFVARSNEVNDVYAINTGWDAASTTWISFAGATSLAALQSKLSPAGSPYASFTPDVSGAAFNIDITTLVQAWSNGDFPNEGLAINNLNPGGDSAQFYTDNFATINLRPLLTIDYNEVAVPAPAPFLVMLAGLGLIGLRRRFV